MNQENFVTRKNECGSFKGPDENTKIGLKRVRYELIGLNQAILF